jgi:hypothetical protein
MIPLNPEKKMLSGIADLLNKLLTWLDWPLSPDFETDGKPYALLNAIDFEKKYAKDLVRIKIRG